MQGVSTRKVKAITEELCGHAFSASAINKRLDESLDAFAKRPLAEPFPYLILDARYEKVREGGVVASQAVLIAIGIDWDGRRQILAVDMANRESRSSWRDFPSRIAPARGVEFVVADDHAGLRSAIRRGRLPAGLTSTSSATPSIICRARPTITVCRSCAGFTTGARSRRRARISPPKSRRIGLAAWIAKWGNRYPKLVGWAEETIEETLAFYRLPRQHHKHPKSANMLERLNEEIKRPDPRCPHLPQCRGLPAPRPRPKQVFVGSPTQSCLDSLDVAGF